MTLRSTIFIALLFLAPSIIHGEPKDPVHEQVVKIISEIDSYVSWPEAKADAKKPFFVAVLGKSDLATRVRELDRKKLSDGRKIRVRIVSGDLLPSNAHIVINTLTDEKLATKYLKKLNGTGTLTISTGDIEISTVLHLGVTDTDGKQTVSITLNTKLAAIERLQIKSKLKAIIVNADA